MSEQEEPKQYVLEHVRQALAADERVHELSLDVKLAGQRLFVSGSVPTPERKAAVAEVIAELFPDYELSNEIGVSRADVPDEVEELT